MIEMFNEDVEAETPQPADVPILYSNCTGYRGQPFMRFYDFLRTLKG